MLFTKEKVFDTYIRVALSLLITLLSCRVFEYFSIASKSFVDHAIRNELSGLVYDVWFWLIYCFLFLWIYLLFSFVRKTIAVFVFHSFNVLLLVCYLGLLITFSERNTPFDHEFFTRSSKDTFLTVKQMMTTGFLVYLPFLIFLFIYLFFYFRILRKVQISKKAMYILAGSSLIATLFFGYSNPSPDGYEQNMAYYQVSNKLSYWIKDSYEYFSNRNNKNLNNHPETDIKNEITFYHQNQPFDFTGKEYPLMHKNVEKDVLGDFFQLKPSLPNIVLIVVEGLSRDFSGKNAFAGSFTPFLDSLSDQGLVWDNFISTAPGTFAAHPAISGSLPYGKRGFSIMNIMPDHLSLIKIMKQNGYRASFMIGFNPDFDNMGGFIREQGTDLILSKYGSKYKEMGVGKEGWSMGYPDDALYNRSFEVMDSLKKEPYLNIYHTATTHLPYLFAQKQLYNKRFDAKLKTMQVSDDIKRTLQQTKHVLTTFMFSDDCLRSFFKRYAQRPEYNNTIFMLTGDHHIGSFPAKGEIDDYHVPLIIYSPLLKKKQRFLSVNSHNNITPTLLAFLSDNYPQFQQPKEVHWMGGVLDTAISFRNKQSMAFMSWSREITDYIYKEYFISEDQLYHLKPDLSQEKIHNDTLRDKIIRLRENFKAINYYVCDNNRVYPDNHDMLTGKQELLYTFSDSVIHKIYTRSPDTSIMKMYKVPTGYKYLYIHYTADVEINDPNTEKYPTLRFGLVDTKNKGKSFLYWSKRDMATLSATDFVPGKWNSVSSKDMFTLSEYTKVKDLYFDLALFGAPEPINLSMKKIVLRVYGIK